MEHFSDRAAVQYRAEVADVTSPVVGSVWKIQVDVGDTLATGDEIMILESMKMEIPVEAERAGTVVTIAVAEGDQVTEGQTLATID